MPPSDERSELTTECLMTARRRIEAAIVPVMERLYGHGEPVFPSDYRPGLKYFEKVSNFYDYAACGLSVLAPLARAGDLQASRLVAILQQNMEYYSRNIYAHDIPDFGLWTIPLRRVLLHLALAYRALDEGLSAGERRRYQDLVEQQVPLVIAHCRHFLPGRRDLHLAGVNNHTAIFMQGVWYCGQVFGRPDWSALAHDFAERFAASGHPDGYFEEHTNADREGGPSLVYTPLTAGCLYDVLGGKAGGHPGFIRAGDLFRALLNERREMIPLADERTNGNGVSRSYGLALHTLTPRGRAHVKESLEETDFTALGPEELAVIYHELDLMRTGPIEVPEYRVEGAFRLTLPLGVLRGGGFTAGLSAMRALNWTLMPDSDYALDHQTMVYLSHRDQGVLLSGFKSKRDPDYSTFRIGEDAYPVRTGTLAMGGGWAEARLHYATFAATLRWDVGQRARLTLGVDTDRPVVTTLPCAPEVCFHSTQPGERVTLKGFSPYTRGNTGPGIAALRFQWTRELQVEFETA